jgi:uracil-DNA glycosylase
MIRRADVLRELKLLPVWRLRRPQAPDTVSEAGDTSGDERRSRIATLTLDALVDDIAGCTACALCKTRRMTVPGVGDPRAQWMFVGEAPGADEDSQGEPFVGAAGQLLDNMLVALGLARTENVYIANVLKCRPPNNRTPEPAEALACAPYLDRQIELIAPRLIVALGRSAAGRPAEHRCAGFEPSQSRASLSRHAADRHVSPGLPFAHAGRQGEGVGGPAVRAPYAA